MGLATGDTVQLTFRGTLAAQRILTVLHCQIITPDPTTSITQDLFAIADRFSAPALVGSPLKALLACQATNVTQLELRAQRVWPQRSIYMSAPIGANGTYDAACITPNIAASLEKRTTHSGRKGIGRVQIAGVPTEVVSDGLLGGPYRALMDDLGFALVGTYTLPASPLQLSFCLPSANGDPSYRIFGWVSMDTVRTMHRRTVRLGE